MNNREMAIRDKAYGEGVKAGWNAANRISRKSCDTIFGKQNLDVSDPDESVLRAAENMIRESRKHQLKDRYMCRDCRIKNGYKARDKGAHTAILKACEICGEVKTDIIVKTLGFDKG